MRNTSAGRHNSADPVRWTRAQILFHAAAELSPPERARYLETACGDDRALQHEVASLLDSDALASDFIEAPAATLLSAGLGPAVMSRLQPGDLVGRYEIHTFLGAGGLCEVYRARDTRLGRDVALKVVTDPADSDAGSRLLTEAQHASTLNHPNICAVFEAESSDGLPFIVLELVEGPTLQDVLRQRRITLEETLRWASDIAAALQHAHSRGIIHRDLKSANVAVAADGGVKVLDFGLSRRLDVIDGLSSSSASILADASIAGTLTHMAPEVLTGQAVDHRVDLWAFGVMLYEMTSGALPFKGRSPLQTATAIVDSSPAPLPPSVPPALRRVIERCLQREPALRFATAAQLREALRAVALDRPGLRRRLLPALLSGAVVAVVTGGWLWNTTGSAPPETTRPVLAVLPFQNADGSGGGEPFFVAGMAEGLVSQLGRIDGIRVLAASTTLRLVTPGERERLASDIGATHLLEGSIARTRNEVHLTARLVESSTDRVVWTAEYRRSARELQALHASIAADIARGVQVKLSADDATALGAVRSVAPDVYEAYLKGRYHWNQRTTESIRVAVSYFESALTLDPTYAPAYAALADGYNQLGTVMVGGGPPREWRPKAAAAAIKALQIEPQLAEAHATLGYVRHYDWEWNEAESSFRRSIELNPSNALARIWYANFLCSRLRLDEAVREVMIARELDPLSSIINTNVGWVLFMARRTEAAIDQYKMTLALDAGYLQAQSRLASALLEAGDFDEAIEMSAAVARATSGSPGGLVSVEQAKMLAGKANEFERMLDATVANLHERYVSPGAIANYYFSLGGRRDADGFRWLEDAHRERTNNIAYLAVEPAYDRVRTHPRFRALVAAVDLP